MPKERGRHVSSLDGLRALCALGVVAYHMGFNWSQGGLIGVTVFFVLSGYLVTSGLLKEFRRSRGKIDLKRFWTKRLKRIMPTAVVFVIVVAATVTFANHLLMTKMRPDIAPGLLMVLNWFKIFTNESYFAAAGAPSPLTHFWYLAIDMQFYLIWPPVLYALMRRRTKSRTVKIGLLVATAVSALLMALLYTPGEDPSRSYYGTDTRAMSLLLGCWLALVWPFEKMSRRPLVTKSDIDASGGFWTKRTTMEIFGGGGVILLILMMIFTEGYSSFSYYGGVLLCSVVAVVAIVGLVAPGTTVSKVMSAKPLVWLGERSFAIYIWHYPIIELLQPRNATMLPWWIYLVELALTLVIAELSYRFIEEPFRKKGFGAFKQPKRELVVDESGVYEVKGRPVFSEWAKHHIPATAIACVVTAIAVIGIATVPAVAVGGGAADEKKVMSASLKKPLVDGVYDVVFIGDSVSLGANEQLNALFPHGLIDTEGNRQIYEALPIYQGYLDQGVVGDTVVISLSTNGYAEPEELEQIMTMSGPDRTVWFVNIRTPDNRCEPNNAAIQACVDSHENARLIDWYGATAGHDEWLIDDGIHLTYEGRDAYAKLVVDTMGYVVPNEENTKYDVTFIGDAVALDAADQLAALFPHGIVDCADGRTLQAVGETIDGYLEKDVMGAELVLCIGNEEALDRGIVESFVSKAGAERKVWLINDRCSGPWCTTNNDLLAGIASSHENVELIDWYAASTGHDEYLAEDGMNLTEAGIKAFADTVHAAMGDRTAAAVAAAEGQPAEEGTQEDVENAEAAEGQPAEEEYYEDEEYYE